MDRKELTLLIGAICNNASNLDVISDIFLNIKCLCEEKINLIGINDSSLFIILCFKLESI